MKQFFVCEEGEVVIQGACYRLCMITAADHSGNRSAVLVPVKTVVPKPPVVWKES